MTLSNISLYELRQYLSILLWIALPLIVVTLSVTVILHNLRKKRRLSEEREAYPDMVKGIDFLAQTSTDMDTEQPAYKGMIWLRTRYRQDMEKADHKIHILSEECRRLEKKVEDLLSISPAQSLNKHKKLSENSGQAAHADVAVKIHDAEISANEKQQIDALQDELARLREVNTRLRREMNESGKSATNSQEPIPAFSENNSEELNSENERMRADKSSNETLIEEKTEQVRSLQVLNEQRTILISKLQSAAEENTARIKELEDDLSRQSLERADEKEAIHDKLMHAESAQNEIQALKDQHLQEKTILRETLDVEIKRSKDLHKKLELSSGLLQKIVKEINTTAFETPRISYKEGHPPVFNKTSAEEKRPKISAWTESSLGEEN